MNVHDALFYLSNSQGRAVWRVGGWGYSHSVPMRRNVSRTLRWAYAACRPHAATQRRPPPPAPRQPRRASSFRERARRAMRRATVVSVTAKTCDTNVWSPDTATTPVQSRECMVLARTRSHITYSHPYYTPRTLSLILLLVLSPLSLSL